MSRELPITELHDRIQAYLSSSSIEYSIIVYGNKREKGWAYSFFGSRVQILINPSGGADTIEIIDFNGSNYDEILEWFKQRLIFHRVIKVGDERDRQFRMGEYVEFLDVDTGNMRHGIVHDVTRDKEKCIAKSRRKYYFVRRNQAGELEGTLQQK